jgi:hypothetical protein
MPTWVLRSCVFVTFLTIAYQYDRYSNTFFSYLFIDWELSEWAANLFVQGMITSLVFGGVCAMIPKNWAHGFVLLGAFALGMEAYALTVYPADETKSFNLFCYALRCFVPVALVLLASNQKIWAIRMLCWASSITFLGHGSKALMEYVVFLDYLLALFSDIGYPITLQRAVLFIHIIGTIDIALAHHAMFFHRRRILWVFRYMAVWGLIAALSRMTFMGLGSWHEVLSRAPHFIGPFVVLMLLKGKKNVAQ